MPLSAQSRFGRVASLFFSPWRLLRACRHQADENNEQHAVELASLFDGSAAAAVPRGEGSAASAPPPVPTLTRDASSLPAHALAAQAADSFSLTEFCQMRKAWWALTGAGQLVACPEGMLHRVLTLEPTFGITFNYADA